MAEETQETTTKKLTLEDPVDPETLKKLSELRDARLQIADRLIDLENERVRMMVAVRQIDGEKNRIFERVLVERGLPPGFPVNIDGTSGKMNPMMAMPGQEPPAAPAPEAPVPPQA
jgi:hypothetical protein